MLQITPQDPYTFHFFESNRGNISFPQGKAVLNIGTSTLETFGLMNCLAIGGIFTDLHDNPKGCFLTHESPTDIDVQMVYVDYIYHLIRNKGYHLKYLLLFKIEPEGESLTTMYSFMGNKYRYRDLCDEISTYMEHKYDVKPAIIDYGHYCTRCLKNNKDPRLEFCGKAVIDPTKDYVVNYFGKISLASYSPVTASH
jgi:hypothetical protein